MPSKLLSEVATYCWSSGFLSTLSEPKRGSTTTTPPPSPEYLN
jgi:hypothetical protein